ncbi:hypothetical protein [Bacillus thuringiensis]|uniref:hypothetical protein n=1 Tax=Bacillus thuringiensis TaxID=1428 RepID=UPI001483CEDF|nr:hypothetical protein [Bacillus thuringiensis]
MDNNNTGNSTMIIYICLGMSLGSAFGLLINNLALGIILGMAIGFGVFKLRQKQ